MFLYQTLVWEPPLTSVYLLSRSCPGFETLWTGKSRTEASASMGQEKWSLELPEQTGERANLIAEIEIDNTKFCGMPPGDSAGLKRDQTHCTCTVFIQLNWTWWSLNRIYNQPPDGGVHLHFCKYDVNKNKFELDNIELFIKSDWHNEARCSFQALCMCVCVCFRWRPKRASDKLCQREEDKHTPAAKKQWGEGWNETHTQRSKFKVPNRMCFKMAASHL